MTEPYYQDEDVTLYLGDCLDVLAAMEPGSIDAIVTDPPYGLEFMGCEWDTFKPSAARIRQRVDGRTNPAEGKSVTVTPEAYVAGLPFQRWCEQWAAECLRVLKPGGHLLAFGGTRTWHRLVCGIEDAGFEVRDAVADLTGYDAPGLMWVYGSGFPKSLDVSKAIDKAAGAERASRDGQGVKQGTVDFRMKNRCPDCDRPYFSASPCTCPRTDRVAVTEEAARWEGWGTALKPGWEPIAVGRKPLAGTVAGNVLAYGTGALNIDGCRVGAGARPLREADRRQMDGSAVYDGGSGRSGPFTGSQAAGTTTAGRWPPNILLTHSAECQPAGTREIKSSVCGPGSAPANAGNTYGVLSDVPAGRRGYGLETVQAWACAPDCPVGELDRQSGVSTSAGGSRGGKRDLAFGMAAQPDFKPGLGDTGGASRFFPVFRYEAKAPASERPRAEDGAAHPTVKPVDLMRWLVRLVTPPDGLVLDPFAGSGTTAEACIVEGFRCVLAEKDPASAGLIVKRLRKPIQPVMFGDVS